MRPLVTSLKQRLHKRHIKQAIITPVAAILLLLALLPALLTLAIRYQVPRMGLGQVEIGDIDINPFRGTLLLQNVALYRSAARVFSAQQVELNLAVLSLLEQRVHIQSLRVDGLELTIKQEVGGPLQIAGISLPAPAEDAKFDEPASPAWGFGIDDLVIVDSALNLIHPRFPETIELDQITVGPLAMWRPDYPTPVQLRVGLREGVVKLHSKLRPFSQTPRHQIELEVESLPMAAFEKLARPEFASLAGTLSTRMSVELQQQAGVVMALKQQGELSLRDLRLQSRGHRLTQQGLKWKGELSMSDVARPETLIASGLFDFTALAMLPEKGDTPYLSLGRLSLDGIEARGTSYLAIKDITVDSIQAEAVRSNEGMWLAGMPSTQSVIATTETTTTTATATTAGATPLHFKIGRLHMTGENRFGFDDRTVKPPFRHALIVTEAEVLQLDNSKPEQPTRVKLQAKDDFYTTINVEGEGRPFAQQLSLNLKTKLQNYDMPPASPYLTQLLGYRITTGQLDSDVTLTIEQDELKGEVSLAMNQLQLNPEDPARIEQTQAKLPMPLNTALSLLRDRDDNIKLKLPISGKLSDPQFDLDDILQTALGKALKTGSISYLKHLLQPYGTLITLVQLAGKANGSIGLDPVVFAAGSGELTADSAGYLEKLATLMNEKSSINMRLCGFATTTDLELISKGKEKAIPAAGHPQLEALAKQRAESIKSVLVKNHGVQPKQLFICHPELDREEGAGARVELSL